MVKRMFIPAQQNQHAVKIYLDDVHKIHKLSKRARPKLPSFSDDHIPHIDDLPEFKFEPLDLKWK